MSEISNSNSVPDKTADNTRIATSDINFGGLDKLDITKQFTEVGDLGEGRKVLAKTSEYAKALRQGLDTMMLNLCEGGDQSYEKGVQLTSTAAASNFLTGTLIEQMSNDAGLEKTGLTEIVSSGSGIPYYGSLIGNLLVNPSTVDPRTFRKMAETDDTIQYALQFNIDSIVQSIGNYVHKNVEIQDMVRHTIENLSPNFDILVRDICTAFIYGFSIVSFTWGYDEVIEGNTILGGIPLPQTTLLFSVDSQGFIEENGIGQFVYNGSYQNLANSLSQGWGTYSGFVPSDAFNINGCNSGNSGNPDNFFNGFGNDDFLSGSEFASVGDLEYPYRLPYYTSVGLVWLPRQSVLHYANYGVASQMNPYGKSSLRAVYNLWLQKLALQQIRMFALDRRSFPLVVVYCESRVPLARQDPTTGMTQSTPQTMIDNAQEMIGDVSSLSSVFVPMDSVKIETLKVDGDIGLIHTIEDNLNARMSKNLGVPEGLSQGGDSSSYAAATRHGTTNSMYVASRCRQIKNCLIRDFVRPIIEQNFPVEIHEKKWGRFENELLTLDEKIKNSTLFDAGIEKGYINRQLLADMNMMREGTGLAAISEEDFPQFLTDTQEQIELLSGPKGLREKSELTDDNYTRDTQRKNNG